ncbi:hypothetical protein GG344DRAFT_69861 [Lentinula edodes]|nr:hypothetical protein GG344DRAFT_69861 [Lentinula edodes]
MQNQTSLTNPDAHRGPTGTNRHLFGLNPKGYFMNFDFDGDYEQRFPSDAMYEELGPNARVWKTYLAETNSLDENMIGEARDGLDSMLVFAGLFSAVVSTLLVQATQNLQVNYTQVTTSLVFELVQIQRAVAVGASVTDIPTSLLSPTTKAKPDNLNVWTNGLWGISLSLSLSVALATVLVKQWLHRYLAVHSGTPRDRSHTRQFRYTGFEKWQVLNIIGVLPVIMHISLAFFLVLSQAFCTPYT